MRVVAGTLRGRPLQAPRGPHTRPTSDRVREALFSMLESAGAVAGARVLDLFAGSGALGIEALSRGARRPAAAFLSSARASGRQYDLVFLHPPYRLADVLGPQLSTALPDVLAPEAVVAAESDRRAPLELDLPLLIERRYGDTLIRIYGS